LKNLKNLYMMNKEEIIEYGISVFEKENIFLDWIMLPNKALNGLVPYDLLNTKDSYKVMDIIGRIKHGIYS